MLGTRRHSEDMSVWGRACMLCGTKRKLMNWKGTQTFQLATSVDFRSWRSFAGTSDAWPCREKC